MRSLVFEGGTWLVYEAFREKNKPLHKALCQLLKAILRSHNPATGLGKPKSLKHNLAGLWSERIPQKDRLVYKFDEYSIYIGHW
jgi:toxin YoeB